MELVKNLNSFLAERFKTLPCRDDTKAYIINIFVSFQECENDLSNSSITLVFAEAKINYDFASYQKLGDWILFAKSIHPEHLKFASPEYYSYIGKSSYDACYRILNKKWVLFQELSDKFDTIHNELRKNINNL